MKAAITSRFMVSGQYARQACPLFMASLHCSTSAAAARHEHTLSQLQRRGSVHIKADVNTPCTSGRLARSTRRMPSTRVHVAAEAVPDAQTPQEFSLLTAQGHIHTLLLMPGTSTIGHVRRMAAEKTGWPEAQVRLAYAGMELSRQHDAQVFQVKSGNTILHTTKLEARAAAEPSVTAFEARTMDGRVHKIPVQPGTTTGRDIRAAVATKMGASPSEVRLSYAGKEVDPNNEDAVFAVNPRITAMQAMQRMQGGQAGAAVNGRRKGCTTWTAPGTGRGFKANLQLAKQFRDLMKKPMPGISVAPDEQDEMKWHVKLAGPAGTPYEGGWFDVELLFSNGFPGRRPEVLFVTPIWHPNISSGVGRARVCVDLGDDVRSVSCVLSAVQMLLAHPNTESPLNSECAKEMVCAPGTYAKKAKAMTHEHAMG